MKKAYLFAGQGQQFLFMGQDLYEAYPVVKEIYDKASAQVGFDILNLSEEQLNQTEFTQVAVLTLNYALSQVLPEDHVDYVAGLSLGEYSALVFAGVLSFEQALDLVLKRSKIMALALRDTGMVALLRTDIEAVEALIEGTNVAVCNHNTPSQVVVGGYNKDLDELLPVFKEAGIRAVQLKVSSVSHMHLMNDASELLKIELEKIEFLKPEVSFVNNLEAKVQVDGFVESLSKQISHRTRLSETIQLMIDQGVRDFVEIGPKGSLKSCVLAHDKSLTVHSVYDLETLKEVLAYDAS